MSVNSLESIFCVALFVVPGYITSVIKGRLCPTANVSDGVGVIRGITLSLLNFLLWFWLYGLILSDCAPWENAKTLLSFRGLLLILALFITSAINAFIFAIISNLLKCLKLLKWLRWPSPYLTSWDYMFHKFAVKDGLFLEIILKKDDKCIKGVFTGESQVAYDADGKFVDILFKEVCRDKNDDKPCFGKFIWISRDEVKFLKLLPVSSEKGGEKNGE